MSLWLWKTYLSTLIRYRTQVVLFFLRCYIPISISIPTRYRDRVTPSLVILRTLLIISVLSFIISLHSSYIPILSSFNTFFLLIFHSKFWPFVFLKIILYQFLSSRRKKKKLLLSKQGLNRMKKVIYKRVEMIYNIKNGHLLRIDILQYYYYYYY